MDRTELAARREAPSVRALVRCNEEREHGAGAHQAEAPVVDELPGVRLLVRVARDLEIALTERGVGLDDVGHLFEDLLPLGLE